MVLATIRFDRLLHRTDVFYPDGEMVQPDEVFPALGAAAPS
jgi:hypothetical protein